MSMTPRLRRFALAAHVTSSVGWLGAVVAYLALAIAGLVSRDTEMVRAAYLTMPWIGWYVIVPLSLASLLTGLVQSLGTEWGLFRHYWILVKFLLTTGATIVLLVHMRTVRYVSSVAAETVLFSAEFAAQRIQLVVHAGGALLVLLAATVLSVYKPWGRTWYERGKQHERRQVPQPIPPPHQATMRSRRDRVGTALPSLHGSNPNTDVGSGRGPNTRTSRARYVLFGIIGLVLVVVLHLFVILHLTGGGLGGK